MISVNRWKYAQKIEENYQNRKASNSSTKEEKRIIGLSNRKSDRVSKLLDKYGNYKINSNNRVVEIGSGSHGIIWRLTCINRIAIDPLAVFYSENFDYLQNNATQIIAGKGEEIPLEDTVADIILSENVLDHTQDPKQVLEEANRILRPGGLLYLSVDIHSAIWRIASTFYNRLFAMGIRLRVRAFPAHPHHFSKHQVYNLLNQAGFRLLWEGLKTPKKRPGKQAIKQLLGKNQMLEIIAVKAE